MILSASARLFLIIIYTSARLGEISPICEFTMYHSALKVISLFCICIRIGMAIDVGKLSVVNDGQDILEVCLSKDAKTHTCSVVVGHELLNFEMDALDKPYGRSFSLSWIGVIDYASGAFKLYPRGQIPDFCRVNKQSLIEYRKEYEKLHPFYPQDSDYADFTILPWLMKIQSFKSEVFYGSFQKAVWFPCQSLPEIPDQH